MDLNIEAWPELLMEFGPYAVLILFALLVAPRASKRLRDVAEHAPKAVRMSAAAVVIGSWSVVLLMVVYVIFQWSPIRVYEGSLGVLSSQDKIYPLVDNLYLKVEGTQAPKREKWAFVVVSREDALSDDQHIEFSHYWGTNDTNYADYVLPVSAIKNGAVREFRLVSSEQRKAGAIYTWINNQWSLELASISEPTTGDGINWGLNAYADTPQVKSKQQLQQIVTGLQSVNRVTQARARRDMRTLSNQQLQELKGMVNQPKAKQLILQEEGRRK